MPTKNKKYYILVNRKSNYLMGCFPRTKEGKKQAEAYKNKLEKGKDKTTKYVIK